MKQDLNWGVGICHYNWTLVREGFYLQWRVIKKDGTCIHWEILGEHV